MCLLWIEQLGFFYYLVVGFNFFLALPVFLLTLTFTLVTHVTVVLWIPDDRQRQYEYFGLSQRQPDRSREYIKVTNLIGVAIFRHFTFTFTRRFYPKRPTVLSGYTFIVSMCVPWELNPQPFVLLTQCSTTELQEHFPIQPDSKTILDLHFFPN